MNFKGTANIPREQMKGIVERFGGMWNGYTWIDQTTYIETAGRAALDQMLFIESERMANGLFDPAECESERTVIISELQGGENDPDQLLDTEVTATAFRAHPYGHPTIGWLDDLQSMTRDDLYGHYRRFYIPNNATLVVVGDVDTDEVLRRAANALQRMIRPGAAPERIRIERAAAARRAACPGRARRDDRLREVRIPRAGRAADPDFFPMLVLDAVLTGAKGVNLWSSFRGAAAAAKGAAVYAAGREVDWPRRYRARCCRPTEPVPLHAVAHGDGRHCAGRARSRGVDEIERVPQRGVEPAEVARAKRQLRARLRLRERQRHEHRAIRSGYFETVRGSGLLRLAAGSASTRVTAEQVWDVARRRLDAANRTVGWFSRWRRAR